MKLPLALQLFSVREEMAADYKKTLERVAELGFTGVEFAGFFDIPAEELKAQLDACGLKAAGSHTAYDLLLNDLDGVIAYNKAIGNGNITCPGARWENKEQADELIGNFKKIASKLAENGLAFGYHNHAHEFFKIGDQYALEYLYTQMARENFVPEIDTYWVFNAGLDPVAFVRAYANQAKLIHLKDGTKSKALPLGEGDVDIQAILDVSAQIGAQWVIVEDETQEPKGFASVEIGMRNLRERFGIEL